MYTNQKVLLLFYKTREIAYATHNIHATVNLQASNYCCATDMMLYKISYTLSIYIALCPKIKFSIPYL